MNDIQQSLLIHAMNEEAKEKSTIEKERFKQMLIAAHPENTKRILRIFKEDDAKENGESYEDENYIPEQSDEPLEIEGLDITDVLEGISKSGGFIEDVSGPS